MKGEQNSVYLISYALIYELSKAKPAFVLLQYVLVNNFLVPFYEWSLQEKTVFQVCHYEHSYKSN